jgi:5'-3' exonuclease
MNYIFIDGSYFIFYRFHAILTWWRNAKKEEPTNVFQNPEFLSKFVNTFEKELKIIKKQIPNADIFVGKDCMRENIWRTKLFPEYKLGRKDCPEIGDFFTFVYKNHLFENEGADILDYDNLEADDCIALSVKYLLENKKEKINKIYVFTSDKDYLQLSGPNVNILNLKFVNLAEQKSSTGNAKCDLFCKILMGDASDNIPSVFKKCGPKTALKCFEDEEFFKKKMETEENAKEKYELNETLVSFDKIPQELKEGFIIKYYKNG